MKRNVPGTHTVCKLSLFNGVEAGGSVLNSGTITATANSTGTSDVEVVGLVFLDDLDGNLTNSGTISVNAGSGSSLTALGIDVLGEVNANIVNSGTISVVATDNGSLASAAGVRIQDDVTGSLVNSGSVSVTASGATSASARGIELQNDLIGSFENSGSIMVAAGSSSTTALAAGVFIGGQADGDVSNSGSVNVRADGGSAVTAAGIALGNGLTGTFTNSGTISTNATLSQPPSGSGPFGPVPQASGLAIAGATTGDVVNGGRIDASIDAGSGASAAGVWLEDLQGEFSNTGAISAAATGGADAIGLFVENLDGEITDVGRISATSDQGNAYSIFLNNGSGTLNVDTEDRVTGLIRVQDHNVNLDAQGGSAVVSFEDAAPGSGTFTTIVSDGRSAWFVQDPGGAAPVYAVVDGADIAPLVDLTAYYGSVVGRVRDALRYNPIDEVSKGWGSVLGTFRPFAIVDAEARQFESDIGTETDVTLFNGSAGFSGQLDNGLSLAVGMGVFNSDGDNATTDFDTTGFYLDAAIGRQIGAYTVEAGLGYGWLSTDRTRQIVGSADASADYDSTLLTAHVGVERAFDVSEKIALLGFGDVRYTRQEDDAYTETGSSTNASVGEITTEVIEARLGVEVEKSLNNGSLLIGQLSGVLRRDLGDDAATVSVFSSAQSLSFASTDFTGASLLLGYEKDLLSGMTLELTAEQEFGDAAQGPNIRAGLRWSF